jgi:hypothetical protein
MITLNAFLKRILYISASTDLILESNDVRKFNETVANAILIMDKLKEFSD